MRTPVLVSSLRTLFFFSLLFWIGCDTPDSSPISEPIPSVPLEVSVWAQQPMLKNPVAISHDPQGRLFASESNRRRSTDLDIRFMNGLEPVPWQVLDWTLQSVEERQALLRTYLSPNSTHSNPWLKDFNGDESTDWYDLLAPSERVNLLVDTNGDGKADQATVFAEGFDTEITGTAGGVLWTEQGVYFTAIPDLWFLKDEDEDGVAEIKEKLISGHGVHIGQGGHDLHGLTMGPDGRLYWSIGDKGINITSKEGKHFFYPNQGLILRSELDGSHFEVYAHGIRNCQEFSFDAYANLFCVDNDGDFAGERERLIYVTEGSDTGWRINWQYNLVSEWAEENNLPDYLPWMEEDLSIPYHYEQAAYITPALANYSNGPAGFLMNPGTALSEAYEDYIFITQFPGQLISAFQLEPDGASFQMINEHTFHQGFMATGLSFSPDGALYVADWAGQWAPTEDGAIVKIDVAAPFRHPMRDSTRVLIEQGMALRDLETLVDLLHYPDQRIRMNAQFELVQRQAYEALTGVALSNSEPEIARMHALWGLGQLARNEQTPETFPVMSLLSDERPEIRVQALRFINEVPALYPQAVASAIPMLSSTDPRLQFHAAQTLGKLKDKAAQQPLYDLLIQNADQDAFLRHAAITGLTGIGDVAQLRAAASHQNRSVRLAAVVALRRLQSPEVAAFLTDADPYVVLEAARAIHDDFSIPEALPALAGLIQTTPHRLEALVRRILNANLRIGTPREAEALLAFARDQERDPDMRAEALQILETWTQPPFLDRVERRYRPLPEKDAAPVVTMLQASTSELLEGVEVTVLEAAIDVLNQYRIDVESDALLTWIANEQLPAGFRVKALEAIAETADDVAGFEMAFASPDPTYRAQALGILRSHNAERALARAQSLLKTDAPIIEKQQALTVLGDHRTETALEVLSEYTSMLLNNNMLDELKQETYLAALKQETPFFLDAIETITTRYPEGNPVPYVFSLKGGDVERGQVLFEKHPSAMCARCHAIEGDNAGVGPDLAGIGLARDLTYLMESLVEPAATIAEGFQMVVLETTAGQQVSGRIVREDEEEIVIKAMMGDEQVLKKAEVTSRTANDTSIMPAMGSILTPQELRDMMAYLASL